MTFSVVAYDPSKQQWGVGVASRFIAVGAVVPWAAANVGAVATQAWSNISFGPRGLEMLRELSAEETVRKLVASDEGRDHRQLGVIDSKGIPYTYTGSRCLDFAGGITGEHYAVQGNILAGRSVIEAMAAEMDRQGSLRNRILGSLSAAQKAGGDRRGKQSAALLIVGSDGSYDERTDRIYDIRVDDHADPFSEINRIADLWDATFFQEEMVPLSDHRQEIEAALKRQGYSDLNSWAFDNNFSEKVSESDIGKNVLRYLTGR